MEFRILSRRYRGNSRDDLLIPLTRDLIPLTRDEIRRMFTGLSRQLAAPAAQRTRTDGDVGARPPPEPATTVGEPKMHT